MAEHMGWIRGFFGTAEDVERLEKAEAGVLAELAGGIGAEHLTTEGEQ